MPDNGVAVEVVSSNPGDCAADFDGSVQVADLQEMHNQFREQLDSGLKMLADNQAKRFPDGPPAGARFGGCGGPAGRFRGFTPSGRFVLVSVSKLRTPDFS